MSTATAHTSSGNFPPTRSSLLVRLRNASDAEVWGIFHAQYQRLVFHVCLKAGLGQQDAEDVAQESMSAVAKAMPAFTLDRSKGSFRGWLRQITSHKVADFLRKKYREGAVRAELPESVFETRAEEITINETLWDEEWQSYLLHNAMETVGLTASTTSMQIFHMSVVQGWSVEQIRATLGLNRAQVYVARYRIGLSVKREIARLRKELD
jgi:RNA polymerase sigma-70 factor, ECF subfamily